MKKTIGVACLAAILLNGCATEFLKLQESIIKDRAASIKEAQAANDQIVEKAKGQRSSAVSLSEKSYLGVKAVPVASQPKPPAFLSRRVELVQDVNAILELVDPLSSIAKVPVVIREDALRVASRGAGSAASAAPQASAGSAGVAPGAVSLSYTGSLSGLLDLIASRFGISWRYLPEGSLEFFYRDTKTFAVMLLPGDITLQSDVGTSGDDSSGAGVGSSRNASQKTSANVSVQFWKDLQDSLNAVKSPDGVVTVSASTGTVTVTDTPAVLARVEKMIDSQNALLTKQVLLDIKVVNLVLKDQEQFGINWNAVYETATGNKFSFQEGGVDIQGFRGQGGGAFTFTVPDGKKLGSTSLILKALAEQSKISSVTSAQQYALNNQATPIQVGRNARFVESSTFTPSTTAGIAGTVTYNTNTISSGVALQLLPRILDNQNLLIHFSVDVSDEPEDLSLASLSKDNLAQISLYKQNVRNFMQRVSLRSGETLVLSGYEKNINTAYKEGVAAPDNLLAGGGRQANSNREIIVIMITPIIMDRVRS